VGATPSFPRYDRSKGVVLSDREFSFESAAENEHGRATRSSLRDEILPIPRQPSDIFGELVVSFTFTHIRTLWLSH
jgi:hypothetical protein